MEALLFLTKKRDKTIKGRMVCNGKPTREWLSREDCASPTDGSESTMLMAVIEAHEGRDAMCVNMPDAFVQTEMPKKEAGAERVTMKVAGVLVDMLTQINPGLHGPCAVFEKGRKVSHVQALRATYGMLNAALLWHEKFRKDLETDGFKFNPCPQPPHGGVLLGPHPRVDPTKIKIEMTT